MSQSIDLGFEAPDYGKASPASSEGSGKTPTKTAYPSITIPGNRALANSLKAGQEFTATVKFRVSEIAIRDRDMGEDGDSDGPMDAYGDGTRVELEAQNIAIDGVSIEDDGGEQDGASAIRKFMGKRAMARKSMDDSGDDGAK